MDVTKAYQVLTDEAIRENWEMYGNPDGYQGFFFLVFLFFFWEGDVFHFWGEGKK